MTTNIAYRFSENSSIMIAYKHTPKYRSGNAQFDLKDYGAKIDSKKTAF